MADAYIKTLKSSDGESIIYPKTKGEAVYLNNSTTTLDDKVLELDTSIEAARNTMVGATSSTAGTKGQVPAPEAGKELAFLRGDGTWSMPEGKTYTAATTDELGLVKSGTDITVDAAGNVSVVNDSHTHDTQYVAVKAASTAGYLDKTTTTPSDTTNRLNYNGIFYGTQIWGAVYNDYAEFRDAKEKVKPGYVVYTDDDGDLVLTTDYFTPGARIVTNTFGMAIGQEENALQLPVAVCGRALAYIDKDVSKDILRKPVCAGPNGILHVMSKEEEKNYPSSIVGVISSVPKQKYFGTGKIKTTGKVWIEVR